MKMYRELAKYYDLLYSRKDYKKEVKTLKKLIKKYRRSSGNELLDLATGTGNHIVYLCKDFNCTGLDLNDEILAIARAKGLPATFIQGDMRHFSLGKEFDVITCLFSSIGYLLTEENLQQTFDCITHHLKPGGLVIIEPWVEKEAYREGSLNLLVYESPELKVVRASVSEKNSKNHSKLKFHFLILEKNKPIRHYVEEHELAMFSHKLILKKMAQAGLETTVYKKGLSKNHRGLLIGIKPRPTSK